MEDDLIFRLFRAKTVRDFANILDVELYAANVDDIDLSLEMLKTLNTSELINIGFKKEDALKLTSAIFQMQQCTKLPPLKKKKTVHFTEELPCELVYEDLSRGEPLIERIKSIPGPNKSQMNAYPSATLHTAASLNNVRTARLILRKNPLECSRKNRLGWTPLLIAVQKGHLEMVSCLCEYDKSSFASRDHNGRTAVMLAASWGHTSVLEFMLKRLYEADDRQGIILSKRFNERDNDGQTAVHLAIVANQLKCLSLMRHYGVNPMIHNGDGCSALEFAMRKDRKEASAILNPRIATNGQPLGNRLQYSA